MIFFFPKYNYIIGNFWYKWENLGTVYCQMSSQKRNVINKREMGIEGDKT